MKIEIKVPDSQQVLVEMDEADAAQYRKMADYVVPFVVRGNNYYFFMLHSFSSIVYL